MTVTETDVLAILGVLTLSAVIIGATLLGTWAARRGKR